jgi:tetratricopeptide (TPR) repeat protein
LFAERKYEEAMDIYLTCLVAVDYNNNMGRTEREKDDLNDETKRQQNQIRRENMEREVQLPVLLNLAACALKLSQYKKVEQFCNIALNDLSSSQENAKLWYRRGKARMFTGQYDGAAADFKMAHKLIATTNGTTAEQAAIERDIFKLATLKQRAKSNHIKYKDALKSIFQQGTTTLYDDDAQAEQTKYSTLVKSSISTPANSKQGKKSLKEATLEEIGIIGWATKIFGECLDRIVSRFNLSNHSKKEN